MITKGLSTDPGREGLSGVQGSLREGEIGWMDGLGMEGWKQEDQVWMWEESRVKGGNGARAS